MLHDSEIVCLLLNLEMCYLNMFFPVFSLFLPSGTPISCLSFPFCHPCLIIFQIFHILSVSSNASGNFITPILQFIILSLGVSDRLFNLSIVFNEQYIAMYFYKY